MDNQAEGIMRNRIGWRAGRAAVAIMIMGLLAGCVVYPAYGTGPYYHHPYGYSGGYYGYGGGYYYR
jgi:hypothetical protein